MSNPDTTVHVRRALLPDHLPAVTAALTGTSASAARTVLLSHGFRDAGGGMVLARIDREEPHYAARAAEDLAHHGFRTSIDPYLQEEIDAEWTWGNHPMPRLTRDEVREVSDAAQAIHDDMAAGRLTIHLHAHDGWTTVAVGTHQDGRHIHLHGEDDLRQVTGVYDTETAAVADFHRLYSVAVRPGTAPATHTERAAAAAHRFASAPVSTTDPAGSERAAPKTMPVRAAERGNHEALLKSFLDTQGEWEKWRTWDDNCTYAIHESRTIRVEFDHEARHRADVAWTVAVHESPVGERLWHATVTAGTPAPIMSTFLDSLASENAWDNGTTPVTEKTIAEATRPLGNVGWTHTVNGHGITLTAPGPHPAGVRFDPIVTHPGWTLWSGNPERPDWAIHLSPYTPAALLQDLTFELAHNQAIRTPSAPARSAPLSVRVAPRHRPVARQVGHSGGDPQKVTNTVPTCAVSDDMRARRGRVCLHPRDGGRLALASTVSVRPDAGCVATRRTQGCRSRPTTLTIGRRSSGWLRTRSASSTPTRPSSTT
ncbi:DUF317 domain-containing protein [Streptomyces sp. NPDC001985]|uniref:DUF317 domain-containing protein n=1 Tax=Streptomyces sp. NPDC001985 TaxID=3154406 RepID=UPI003326C360